MVRHSLCSITSTALTIMFASWGTCVLRVLLKIMARIGKWSVDRKGTNTRLEIRGNYHCLRWQMHYDHFLEQGWRYLAARNFVHHARPTVLSVHTLLCLLSERSENCSVGSPKWRLGSRISPCKNILPDFRGQSSGRSHQQPGGT
jgi:hypothetical protein